jgi:hemin uptake protein HemP
MIRERNSPPSPHSSACPAAPEEEKIVESHDLLGRRDELLIRHDGRIYRLRRTRLGKLILTA